MDFRLIWTEGASSDLRSIIEYIRRDSPQAADRFGEELVKQTELLRSFPLIGPTYRRRKRGVIREIVYGNYRIFYQVDKSAKQVAILSVWHAAREEPADL